MQYKYSLLAVPYSLFPSSFDAGNAFCMLRVPKARQRRGAWSRPRGLRGGAPEPQCVAAPAVGQYNILYEAYLIPYFIHTSFFIFNI